MFCLKIHSCSTTVIGHCVCIGRDGDSAASTTTAGISGIAGNRAVRSGDKEAGITKIFDAVSVQKNIDAQVQITQTFGQLAPKAVADFAQRQADALLVQARNEPDASKRMALLEDAKRWDDGGSYRVAMHAAVGGMGGGVAFAIRALSASPAPEEQVTDVEADRRERALKVDPDKHGHRTRFSDSSYFDEVCIMCGATDGFGDKRLDQPCPKPLPSSTTGGATND